MRLLLLLLMLTGCAGKNRADRRLDEDLTAMRPLSFEVEGTATSTAGEGVN